MNGLPLTPLAPEGSLPPPCRGRGRPHSPGHFSRRPPSNVPLRRLASRQLQTSNPPPTIPPRCCQRQSTPANLMPADNIVLVSPIILKEDFRLREDVYLTFPPEVNDSITREAIGHFQVNIKSVVKHMDYVYCCYSRFVDPLELESIFDNNAVLITAFETYILHRCDLDVCGCCSGSFNFCHDCWTCVSRGRESKFGISSKMSKLCC